MPSLKPLPSEMVGDIDALLEKNRTKCISIYPEAERIRHKWEDQNIALEDVVSVLVERCGIHRVAISFDRYAGPDVLAEDDSRARNEG